ncbi:hypothetical protein GDO86_018118 [Hymenochirus boettgeri]|uniref:Nuclear receptor-interacting protein 3 n=1 Tax=Hymenochirus boettgeri TaxID=247094 RepID=A0A8T2IEY9_9PIPI|nr:hypothetical protein GDO86_018118 [Hymenochirus boettgeri]
MFYSGILTDGGRKEADLREAASLRQQRRMKQAVQFIHKDSADLLPLDGMKKLGTSKDTQPHNILQRRLLETNFSKLRNNRTTWGPKSELSTQSKKGNQEKNENPRKSDEEDSIFVWCQCAGKEVKALIDTSCQYNMISSACLDRLGKVRLSPHNMKSNGKVEKIPVTLGSTPIELQLQDRNKVSEPSVLGDKERTLSIGLQTLRALR